MPLFFDYLILQSYCKITKAKRRKLFLKLIILHLWLSNYVYEFICKKNPAKTTKNQLYNYCQPAFAAICFAIFVSANS